jgi:hypothetical protein
MFSHRVGGFVMLTVCQHHEFTYSHFIRSPPPFNLLLILLLPPILTIYMHEYLADRSFPYGECIECKKRTAHFCIRCHYCYSCHSKVERLEKEKDVRVTRHGYYQILRQSPFLVYKRTRTS